MTSRVKEGTDRGWSWVIVFATFLINLILAGIYRTSGILLVAFVNEFRVSREDASWPLVLCFALVDLTGIVVGPLGQRFGIRPITIIGSLISTVGVSLCYFADSLHFITICFGIIFGCGFGLSYTLMPVIINEYFLNYRATANGISQSGACFGSILFPPLYEYLMSMYYLNGCLLLIGGIILQLVVAGALMKPPSWLKNGETVDEYVVGDNSTLVSDKASQHNKSESLELDEVNETVTYFNSLEKNPNANHRKRSISLPNTDFNITDQKHQLEQNSENKSENALDSIHSVASSETKELKEAKRVDDLPEMFQKNEEGVTGSDSSMVQAGKPVDDFPGRLQELVIENEILNSDKSKNNNNQSILRSFKMVIKSPMFYIILYTTTLFYFVEEIFFVINVDFFLDKKVQDNNIKYIIFAFSFCDLIGRLGLGWVTDRKLLRRSHFLMLCMAIIALVFFLFPFANDYTVIIILNCIYGTMLGCTTVILNVLLVDYLEMDVQAVAFGFLAFFHGLLGLAASTLIGFFRDHIGSYSNIFFIVGALSLVTSFIWLLEKCFVKSKSVPVSNQSA